MRANQWVVAGFAAVVGIVAAGMEGDAAAAPGGGNGGGNGGGGGGGSPSSGTIYVGNGVLNLYSVKPDGSSLTALPSGVYGEASHDLHGGHRWFLSSRQVSGTYVDGWERKELFAVRGDGDVTIQLTDDPDVKPCGGAGPGADIGSLRWGPDDAFFSYRAVDWSGGDPVSRLFLVPVEFDSAGEPSVAGAHEAVLTDSSVQTPSNSNTDTVLGHATWSPDGSKVAWVAGLGSGVANYAVRVTTLGGGTTTVATGRYVTSWSVTDRLLLAGDPDVVESVSASGGTPTVLVTLDSLAALYSRRNQDKLPDRLYAECWSPDGSQFTFRGADDDNLRNDVWRADADGSSPKLLTSGLTAWLGATVRGDWR